MFGIGSDTTAYPTPENSASGSLVGTGVSAELISADPLTAIDWGTKLPTTVVDVYFAPAGTYIDGVADLGLAQGFTAYEKQQFFSVFEQIEKFTNLSFRETTSQTLAEFRLGSFELDDYGAIAFMIPPGDPFAGFLGVDPDYLRWYDIDSGYPLVSRGGFMYAILLEEIGHGLGLAHPHDDGGTSTVLEGVVASTGSYGVGDLNQGVYTMMGWTEGWPGGPYGDQYYDGTYTYVNDFGYEATPMALDIAVLQQKYGANLGWATGNDVYVLPASNGLGTFYECIWDAGGTDTLRYEGTSDAIIDLRAATLRSEAGGGGYVSYASGIRGGYTIAANVVIENATGGAGNDMLTGNAAANLLRGGDGNDSAYGGDQFDTIHGGDGNDTIDGGNGRDLVYLNQHDDLYLDNAQGGDLGRDTVFGGFGADTIQGGNGDDEFHGDWGEDLIHARLGNDLVYGGSQFDTIFGGDGNDTVDGGYGRDLVYLNQHDDLYLDNAQGGELGRDTVFGGYGADTIQGGNGDDEFHGEWGDDLIHARLGNDLVYGGSQFDTIFGGDGNDTVDGGYGRDLVYLNQHDDLYLDNAQGGELGRDTVFGGFGADTIQGGNGDDEFHGEWGDDVIYARLGNDSVFGGDNFDFIDAGDGNDMVDGGNGQDTIRLGLGDDVYVDTAQGGDLGRDTISGGAGADRFEYQAVISSDVIEDFETGLDRLQLTQSLWGGGLSAAQVVSSYASVTGDGVLFDFGGDQSILLSGLNSLAGLDGDILLV